ncbi:MAG: glutaminase A [Frankiales bacterium]|nr:glutaminase A [Frankiales bacterium]
MTDPRRGPVEALLDDVVTAVTPVREGQVATYIPELAKADPSTFGLSVATLDGRVHDAGRLVPFTIQSVSKPFVYALALADSGHDAVLAKVGTEPTGDPFNSISVDESTGRAANPMVNAGAIVVSSMVGGSGRAGQLERIVSGLSAFAGRDLDVDESVFSSERDTGDRNRAIAYFMRSVGLLDDDVDAQVDLYFRQCSVVVTAHDLAVMAATLANGGVNPVTGAQVVPRDVVASVLTVMTTCGMYDYAGEWLYRVGLPAKSGVSGGIAAALPGQLGLGVHSPLLDPRGNSVRGVAAAERLSRTLGLHLLLPSERPRPGIRRSYRDDVVRSRRGRTREQRAVLDREGTAIAVTELTGDQGFASAELLARLVLEDAAPARWRILDLSRVTRIDTAAGTLLDGLAARLAEDGVRVLVVDPRSEPARSTARERMTAAERAGDPDAALERAEDELLREHGLGEAIPEGLVPLAEQDLLRGLPAWVVADLEQRVTTRVVADGTVLFEEGAAPDGLYFVAAGSVSVDVRTRRPSGRRRITTIGAGSMFGELALVDGLPRSTRVSAVGPTICHVLSPAAYAEMRETAPAACAELTLALARALSQRLRYATTDVAALDEG